MSWVHGVVTSTMLRMLGRGCPRCGRIVIIGVERRDEVVPCPHCGAGLKPTPRHGKTRSRAER